MKEEKDDHLIPDSLSPSRLSHRHRTVAVFLVGLVLLVLLYAAVYNYGMRTLEGRPQTYFRSLQAVVATMTTTGYGADAPWTTRLMNAFVMLMQVSGILIGFVTLRVLIIPLFERAPLDLSDRLTPKNDHVIIGEYRHDSGVLLRELETLDVDYVLIASDTDEAKDLSDAGYQVIAGDPEQGDALDRAEIDDARALVADAGRRNASITLTALRRNPDIRVICLTESETYEPALRGVGADAVISPHAVIGRRLAQKATVGIDPEPSRSTDDAAVGDVRVREVVVRRDSPLCGVRIEDSTIADHSDLTLVAAWIDGDLRLPPEPTERITPNAVLLVSGSADDIDDVQEFADGFRNPRRHSNVVVAGAGAGGRAALDALPADIDATTVDIEDGDAVDVVGDVTDPETLEAAGIEEATALIVTVDDDATALLTVALTRTVTDDIDVLVRVTDTEKTPGAFDAGADYVLSIQRVSARLLARQLRGEDVLTPVNQIRIVRADADAFVGQTLADAKRRTGGAIAVIGVERGGEFRVNDATRIEADDSLVVAGTDATVQEFEREFG